MSLEYCVSYVPERFKTGTRRDVPVALLSHALLPEKLAFSAEQSWICPQVDPCMCEFLGGTAAGDGLRDPGTAVGAVGAAVDALDVLQQRVVGLRSRAGAAAAPGIVPALREPVLPAEELDPVLMAVPAYEREDLRLRSKLNWIAFLRRSFSILAFFQRESIKG
jgi:hypothetical protein